MNRVPPMIEWITYLIPSLFCLLAGPALAQATSEAPWVTYEGDDGPGRGKHIVLVSGDEEYRSEEVLPALAKILAIRHGFRCTVLFAVDPETGHIDPNYRTNIPGLHQLASADLMVLFTRFRTLPEDQMEPIVDYLHSGKPIMGLRTATHAFRYEANSPYARYSYDSAVEGWEGGFGRRVLGETWRFHHGAHGEESTRGLVNGLVRAHPILKGVEGIWGATDVYGVDDIEGDERVLVYGQPLAGMEPTAAPNRAKSIMPVAWVKTYTAASGRAARVFTTTMGTSVDLENEGFRRLLVNAVYWSTGLEDQIRARSNVAFVDPFDPTFFGFDAYQRGVKPSDFALESDAGE